MPKRVALVLLITARLLVNLLFLSWWPPVVIACSLFLDSIDGPLYKYYFKLAPVTSQRLDKLLDLVYYICLLAVAIQDNLPLLWLIEILFAMRFIGQILMLVTGKREYLIVFPNLYEYVTILIYLLMALGFVFDQHGMPFVYIMVALLCALKFIHEITLHELKYTIFENWVVPIAGGLGFKFNLHKQDD